jgi:hypothetical protein
MKPAHVTGLGEPEAAGKRALFRPPDKETEPTGIPATSPYATTSGKPVQDVQTKTNRGAARRVHITTDLTSDALQVIQAVQQEHRLKTGKVLPLWKVVSQAIEHYGQTKGIAT